MKLPAREWEWQCEGCDKVHKTTSEKTPSGCPFCGCPIMGLVKSPRERSQHAQTDGDLDGHRVSLGVQTMRPPHGFAENPAEAM